jgi:hypothetical protein
LMDVIAISSNIMPIFIPISIPILACHNYVLRSNG